MGFGSRHPSRMKDVLHVDHWFDAQHVQGVSAENELLVMSRRDEGC